MNKPVAGASAPLILTINRSIATKDRIGLLASATKERKRGTHFKMYKTPPKYCGGSRIARVTKNMDTIYRVDFLSIKCRCYSCPACRDRLIVHKQLLLQGVILKNKLRYLLTLTLDPKTLPFNVLNEWENYTHKYITSLFHDLIRIEERRHGKIKYLWVNEFQENGNAHLHILLDKRLDVVKLRKTWVKLGGGTSLRIERIRHIKAVARYVLSYLVKGFNGSNSRYFYGERRYGISRSCFRDKLIKNKVIKDRAEAYLMLPHQIVPGIVQEMLYGQSKGGYWEYEKGGE